MKWYWWLLLFLVFSGFFDSNDPATTTKVEESKKEEITATSTEPKVVKIPYPDEPPVEIIAEDRGLSGFYEKIYD